eukprot:COSAG05_NODE_1208_length_5523_cov_14.095686_4_plen_46_part_00
MTYPGPPGEVNLQVPNKLGPNDASFVLMRPVRHSTSVLAAARDPS